MMKDLIRKPAYTKYTLKFLFLKVKLSTVVSLPTAAVAIVIIPENWIWSPLT